MDKKLENYMSVLFQLIYSISINLNILLSFRSASTSIFILTHRAPNS